MGKYSLLVVLTALLSGCTNDVVETSYDTSAAAIADGAIQRGWIPQWLPPDATDIREIHNVDTNQSTLYFSLPIGNDWHPSSTCRPAHAGQFTGPSFNRDWIPAADSERYYDFFSCESKIPYPMYEALAVHKDRSHALHWRTLAR